MTYADDIVAGKYKIPISMLHTQAYCEYQIFLDAVKGIEVGRSAAMIEGSLDHAVLDEEHAAKATVAMSLEEALTASAKKKVICIMRDITVMNKYLKGKIDEIHIGPNFITIIDDKPIKDGRVWPPDKKQVWGYCWAYSDQYKPDRPLYGAVRDRRAADAQDFAWQEPFTEAERLAAEETSIRILDILKGTREAVPTKKPQKCRPCRFKEACDKCLVRDFI